MFVKVMLWSVMKWQLTIGSFTKSLNSSPTIKRGRRSLWFQGVMRLLCKSIFQCCHKVQKEKASPKFGAMSYEEPLWRTIHNGSSFLDMKNHSYLRKKQSIIRIRKFVLGWLRKKRIDIAYVQPVIVLPEWETKMEIGIYLLTVTSIHCQLEIR